MTWKYDSSSKNFAFVFFYGKCTDKHRYTKYIRFKKKPQNIKFPFYSCVKPLRRVSMLFSLKESSAFAV